MRRLAAALMLAASTSAQAQTYDPVEIDPIVIPTPAATPTNLGDDATKLVDLGFTFNYFGQEYTQAWISSNGFVSFQSEANLCCNGQPLQQAQRNTIYEFWTDLINWTGTPYYSKKTLDNGTNMFLVGWYDTQEYGSQNKNSFEMYLYDSGEINFNYLQTYDMRYHTVTAGLTGPTSEDNITLFYGSNTGSLSGKAYSFNYKTGTVTVDCSSFPMDPSCIGTTIDTTPAATVPQESAVVQEVATQEEVITEAQEIISQEEQAAVAEVAQQTTTTSQSSSTQSAERLNPAQLAAMNSKGLLSTTEATASLASSTSDAQQFGITSSDASMQIFSTAINSSIAMSEAEQGQQEQQTVKLADTVKESQSAQAQLAQQATQDTNQTISQSSTTQVAENTTQMQQIDTPSMSVSAVESRWQESMVSSQAATLEALNSIKQDTNGESSNEPSSLGDGQGEVIAQIAYVPGFSAYKLITIPDRPDFYKPRRIYKNNRPVDAYMSIFKMTAANDNLWKQMVESQYE